MKHIINVPPALDPEEVVGRLHGIAGKSNVRRPHAAVPRYVEVEGPPTFSKWLTEYGLVAVPDGKIEPTTSQSCDLPKWGLAAISGSWPGTGGAFPAPYDYDATGQGVPVYVADCPLAVGLGEFGGRASMIHNPYGGTLTADHGTNMAALVGGAVHGVAKGVTIHGAAGFDNNGVGTVSSMNAALSAVLSHKQANYPAGKAICLMAFTNSGTGIANGFEAMIDSLTAAGVICVAAAGNNSIDDMANSTLQVWPAMDPDVLCVTACSLDGGRHPQHNIGLHDLIAPGLDNATVDRNGAVVVTSGTSNAAAYAAGALACFVEAGSADPVAEMLAQVDTSRAFGFTAGPQGILYKSGSMAAAEAPPPPPPPPPYTGHARVRVHVSGTVYQSASYPAPAQVAFAGTNDDNGNWRKPGSTTEFVVPEGVQAIQAQASFQMEGIANGARLFLAVNLNGGHIARTEIGYCGAYMTVQATSPRIPVTPGDTVIAWLYCSDSAFTIIGPNSYLQIDAMG